MDIRKIETDDKLSEAMKLVWKVFLEFEAPDYSDAGVQTFKEFIHDTKSIKLLDVYGAYDGDDLLGVIATRMNQSHISLFFVSKEHQGKGVGKRLFKYILPLCKDNKMTVHSSPYAVAIYRQLGFVDSDIEQLKDGIRYTPMEYQKNLTPFLAEDEYIDFSEDIIVQQIKTLFQDCKNDTERARVAYEFVRDEINHSFDVKADTITAKASDVLRYKTGICHAKANLLAALLRSQGIPTGMCYQHLTLMEDESLGYCVHCFNAIYLDQHWIKVDARGNTNGKNAQFSLAEPILAFSNRADYDEFFWPGIYSEPHKPTMEMLNQATSIQDITDNIPDSLT